MFELDGIDFSDSQALAGQKSCPASDDFQVLIYDNDADILKCLDRCCQPVDVGRPILARVAGGKF